MLSAPSAFSLLLASVSSASCSLFSSPSISPLFPDFLYALILAIAWQSSSMTSVLHFELWVRGSVWPYVRFLKSMSSSCSHSLLPPHSFDPIPDLILEHSIERERERERVREREREGKRCGRAKV